MRNLRALAYLRVLDLHERPRLTRRQQSGTRAQVCERPDDRPRPDLRATRVALEHLPRKAYRSLIVSVSSILELYPAGGMSMYCASKAFVHHFGIALGAEL